MTTSNLKWMKEALSVAKTAFNLKEVPVGCVIVYKDEKIIGKGHNLTVLKKNATRHAEFEAIKDSIEWCKNNSLDYKTIFPDCSLYVTCEPCIMCASALKLVNIKKWIFGCRNDKFGGAGSVIDVVNEKEKNDYEITPGVCEEQAINILKAFYTIENENAPETTRKFKTNRKTDLRLIDF
jgi:tRNA-specific adenosine deaminase 2